MEEYEPWCDVFNVALRLVGSSLSYEGRLEIYHNGEWGAVCDTYGWFKSYEADVACYVLGFQ